MSVSIQKTGVVNASGEVRENILIGTHRPVIVKNSSVGTRELKGLGADSGGNGTFSITTETNLPVGIYSFNVLNNTSGNRDYQQDQIPYVTGRKYTGSWWAKGEGQCLYRVWNCTKQSQPMGKQFTLTSNWTYYYHTFTATQEMETDNCTFHLGVTGNASIYICGMKLEEGDYPTDWIPNIEDVDNLFVGSKSGFNEEIGNASITSGYINATEFIEY